MRLGSLVGYALLGSVDAFVSAALTVVTITGVGAYVAGSLAHVALGSGALVLTVGAIAGTLSARRGGRPFPLSRRAIELWKRYWWS